MHRTLITLLLAISLGTSACNMTYAQQINHPTHIPNELANKVTSVRLKALVLEAEVDDEIDGQLREFSLNNLEALDTDDCSVEIGNTEVLNSFTDVERDVIVVGDVVNVCR